jgi:hypothetical protein
LASAKTSAYAHKASQECILAAMHTEKHIIHYPSHPTGVIRKCPVCDGLDSMLHAIIDCALPSYLWNIYALMLTDIAMVLTLDDRFKLMGVLNKKDINKFSLTQVKVALSLACIIRSVLFSEYYKINSVPNTQQILCKLKSELTIMKGISSFYSKWLNNTLSKQEIILQKLQVPDHPPFIRTIEQRVNDLLSDNDSSRS